VRVVLKRVLPSAIVVLGVVSTALVPTCSAVAASGAPKKTKVVREAKPLEKIAEVLDISPVWAAHPVGFRLLTYKDQQFVAFYDDKRQMTVAQRKLGDKTWKMTKLPKTTGWDSHNYITMAVDDEGYLHLSGDMHVNPLLYFRTSKPLDASTFEKIPNMVGTKETRVTYPVFMRGARGEFLYTYRDGSSGNGDQIYNKYDHKTKTWTRLLDKPLSDGEGERNAYFNLPKLGPDGYWHMVWVWRETPDASTNHDPSYARSKDLIHWEKSDGSPQALPITLGTGDIVDPIPVKGGVINGNVKLGFDKEKRPIVSYHKYDAKGNIQIYNARKEGKEWKIYQASDWDWRWDFGGGGSIPFEVQLGQVVARPDGMLTQEYITRNHGSGTWVLDPATLKPIPGAVAPEADKAPGYPAEIANVTSTFPEMLVQWAGDAGKSTDSGSRYVIRWETLGQNRDQPRTGPLPEPTMLRLYKLTAAK
jgi:hypothetical protein